MAESLRGENINLCRNGHHKELARIIEFVGYPLINLLYCAIVVGFFLDFFIDDPETLLSESLTITPILHFIITISHFPTYLRSLTRSWGNSV